MASKKFNEIEIDALGEIMNISLGSSATAISTMLDTRVDITTPEVRVVSKDEFSFTNLQPAVGVEITYISGLDGKNVMLLKRRDVKIIIELLMGMEIPDDEFELDEMNISAICEVMNQMMGASSTALSEFLGQVVNISTPKSFEIADEQEFKDMYFENDEQKVVIGFTLTINEKMESEFVNVMSVNLAKELVSGFLPDSYLVPDEAEEEMDSEPVAAVPAASGGMMSQEEIERMLAGMQSSAPTPAPPTPAASGGMMSQDEIEKMLAGMQGGTAPQTDAVPQANPMPQMQTSPQMQGMPQTMGMMPPVDMQQQMQQQLQQQMQQQMQQQLIQQMQQQMLQLQEQLQQVQAHETKMMQASPAKHTELGGGIALGKEQAENLELVMGVPLEVSVEIGRTQSLVKDILEYTKGTLVVLDKQAGDQVDLFVNGQCIAKGDVVVVDDNFGIRITEVLKQPEM